MTELHLYIAEDGTEFEDEQECLAYEAAQSAKTLKGKVVLLDADFKVIPLDNLADWERTFFIFTKDVSALHELRAVWDWDLTGMCPPSFLLRIRLDCLPMMKTKTNGIIWELAFRKSSLSLIKR